MSTATVHCARCDRNGFATPDALAEHLRDKRDGHAYDAQRAQREAAATFVTTVLPAPDPTAQHVCPKCETVIPCLAKAAAQLDAQAARLKMIAASMRQRDAGTLGKWKRRNQDWTAEEAARLVAQGMSYRAVGRELNAKGDTIKRAVEG